MRTSLFGSIAQSIDTLQSAARSAHRINTEYELCERRGVRQPDRGAGCREGGKSDSGRSDL